jgi:hypothetical protein
MWGEVLAFLDEEEAVAPSRSGGGRPPYRRAPDRQRQILVRRAIGLGVLVVVLILIVLGIRGCLNARKHRNFENYANNLTAIVTQTQQLSKSFFGRLTNPPSNLTPLSFRAEVDTDRGTAESLDARVHDLDTPGELSAAQDELNSSYDLRRDGLNGIAAQIPTALGKSGAGAAVNKIAGYMRYFLASDVLYARAASEVNQELGDQGIDQKVPASVFLPEPITDWLDPLKISSKLAGLSTSKAATSGIHGLALLQSTIGGVQLSTDTATTITGNASNLEVSVQNQGDSTEHDIAVSFELTGGTQTISGDGTVSSIVAGGTGTAKIPIQPTPPSGQDLTLQVTVQPVPGEQVATNNRATYQVSFG